MKPIRIFLLLMVLVVVVLVMPIEAQDPFHLSKEDFPISGKAGPELEVLDGAMKNIMQRHGIPGGALAIAYEGRLIFARAYGWADLLGEPAKVTTFFGLASLSKPITAMAILKLIEEGKLKLEDCWVDILAYLAPPRGTRMDPRMKTITIQQLLIHTGGWNRMTSGDPINFSMPVSKVLKVPQPVSADHLISFMMGMPLDFQPGTQAHYSNLGYIILGQVVEKVSGQKYEDYVANQVLKPMGIRQAGIHQSSKYFPGEARCYLAGTGTLLPPQHLPMVKAAAGWSATPVDMVRFLTALDGSRGKSFFQPKTLKAMFAPPPAPLKPNPNGTYPIPGFELCAVGQKGFTYFQDGNWYGMRTFLKRNPKGVNWVMMFNASMQPDLLDRNIVASAIQDLKTRVDSLEKLPKVDYFDDFR